MGFDERLRLATKVPALSDTTPPDMAAARQARDAEGRRTRASWRNATLCSAPRAPPANKLGYSGRKFAGIGEHHEISCLIRLLPTLWKGSELPALWKGS